MAGGPQHNADGRSGCREVVMCKHPVSAALPLGCPVRGISPGWSQEYQAVSISEIIETDIGPEVRAAFIKTLGGMPHMLALVYPVVCFQPWHFRDV